MGATNEEKRRRGRQPRGYAEKLLARTQYAMVKSRSGLSDSKLDVEYARGKYGEKLSPAERAHVFEDAKNRGKPFLPDVIKRLSYDPRMNGISAISESPFWGLLDKPPTNRATAQRLVERCLKRLNLLRLPLTLEEKWLASAKAAETIRSSDAEEVAREQLERLVRDHPKSLDVIALIGALYREACLSFEPQLASYLGTRFWVLMQDFVAQEGLESLDGDLDMFAIYRIIYDRTETDAQRAMNPFGAERLPGSPIGLLLANDDPTVKELLSSIEYAQTTSGLGSD